MDNTAAGITLQGLAKALGGEVSAGQVLAPGPGHSPADRSLSVKPDASAPDGFVVHSFAGDDAIVCKNHVRGKLGRPPWQPNGKGNSRRLSPGKEMARAIAGLRKAKPALEETPPRVVATYSYVSANDEVLYEVLRLEPKSFRQRRPVAGGGYAYSLGDVQPVFYRLPDLLAFPDATVFFCEGEKDADRLASLELIATTISGSTTWTPELAEPLRDRNVLVLVDNDNPGAAKAEKAAAALHGIAASIRVVLLPELPSGGDVSDWLDAGHSSEELVAVSLAAPEWRPRDPERSRAGAEAKEDGAAAPDQSLSLGEWDAGDDDQIPPPRGWLLGNIFCRQFVSSLLGDGGVGKTAVRYAQLLSLAIGRSLTGEHVFQRCRVLIVSLEDGVDELRRRIKAVLLHHGIALSELKGWLFLAAPGAAAGKLMALDQHGRPVIGGLATKLANTITARKIDIVSLDPFIKTHSVEENSNSAIDDVVQILSGLSITHDMAVDTPHHMSKGPPDPGNANRGRGASSAKDGGRLVYTLTSMTTDEAQAFGLSEAERRRLIRMDSGKVNIAPPADKATWFRLVGVRIGNSTELYPNGDEVQTVEPWTPPETFAGLTNLLANQILNDIDAGLPDGNRYTDARNAAEDRAAWRVIVEHIPEKKQAAAREIIKTWKKAGLLTTREYENPVTRKTVKGLYVDNAKRPS
jgi:hypothetical protein